MPNFQQVLHGFSITITETIPILPISTPHSLHYVCHQKDNFNTRHIIRLKVSWFINSTSVSLAFRAVFDYSIKIKTKQRENLCGTELIENVWIWRISRVFAVFWVCFLITFDFNWDAFFGFVSLRNSIGLAVEIASLIYATSANLQKIILAFRLACAICYARLNVGGNC